MRDDALLQLCDRQDLSAGAVAHAAAAIVRRRGTDGRQFLATFGLVKITTPRWNITGAHITRNYRWWTACGIRMSNVDDGLTFGTNRDGGVCVHFAEKVRSPMRRSGHSALTVTVANLEGLVAELGDAEAGADEQPVMGESAPRGRLLPGGRRTPARCCRGRGKRAPNRKGRQRCHRWQCPARRASTLTARARRGCRM